MYGVDGMSSNYNLKPCPFCGGKAEMWRNYYTVTIQCENYKAVSDTQHCVQIAYPTEEEAVRLWNERYKDADE